MILTEIKALGQDGSRVMLRFDDGTKTRIPTVLVADFGLYGGMELSEEALSELLEAAQRASARDRAVRIVSATRISQRELTRRLVQRGERPEDAEDAVSWLREIGAVDDAAMARSIVRQCCEKGYGEARIRQTLYQKGIPKSCWEEALCDLPDMSDAIDRFLARRLAGEAADEKTIRKTVDALMRRGHSWEDISAGLRRYRVTLEEDGGNP